MSSQTDGVGTGVSYPWPARTRVCRTELDPTSFLHRTATIHFDRVAVVHGEVHRTYAELRERVNRLSSALLARGWSATIAWRRCVGTCPSCWSSPTPCRRAGGVLVAINVRLAAAEVGYILEHSGSRVLFVDPGLEPVAGERPAGLEIKALGADARCGLGRFQ